VRLYKLREILNKEIKNGRSRRELGKEIGIPFTSINNYLDTDMQPSFKTLQKIADYFHKPISYFIDDHTKPDAIQEQAAKYNTDIDKGSIINQIIKILDSGNTGVITALVKNINEFERAVDTADELSDCRSQITAQAIRIKHLEDQINKLLNPEGEKINPDVSKKEIM
jgi:transcriptional regulator with XRE-family HTH domain